MSAREQPRKITLPGHRLRKWAQYLLDLHLRLSPAAATLPSIPSKEAERAPKGQIRVVCVSDTHNNQPSLPPGDVLIHAGDLTENGSFDELQKQIDWLSAQPYHHIVAIAGNHDVLLDEGFLEKYPERRYGDSRSRGDLDWGRVVYLENEDITAEITLTPNSEDGTDAKDNAQNSNNEPHSLSLSSTSTSPQKTRKLKIYGTPLTPQYGISAFQYPSSLSEEIWENKIPADTEILIVHGPPRLHLDFDPNIQGGGLRHTGDAYLTSEIGRVRPRLVVFGHIHVGYGREDLVLDSVTRGFEGIQNRLGGWGTLGVMFLGVFWEAIRKVFKDERVTTFVNAAVVGGGLANELKNEAVVVDI
ncbi:metallophosphatase domain-containing protein [Aspergillus stella-maris]|uniref:metallophosphatase domain-containing protein n=1 Tax=Aspergillus stella-maris TaxID=1810926 RepID=UPI003CCD9D4E